MVEKWNFSGIGMPGNSCYSNFHLTHAMTLVPTMNFEDACRWMIPFTSLPAIHLLHFGDNGLDLSAKWGVEKIQSISSKE